MDAIKGISGDALGIVPSNRKKGGDSEFLDTLRSFAAQVDGEIHDADSKAQEFAVGKRYDLHEIMIATEKADLSFRLLLQIRNKLMDAYQEIMRMQL